MKLLQHCKSCARRADTWTLFAASFFLILFFFAEVQGTLASDNLLFSAFYRAFLLLLICALFYLGGVLRIERTKDPRIMRPLICLFFLLYLYLIFNFTLADASFGRGVDDSIYLSGENMREYYREWFVNLRPFDSIYKVYIKGFLNDRLHWRAVFLNLLGNFCAFMPMSFFLPYLFKKQRRWYVFLVTALLTVTVVESLQYAFMVGSCDVDDLILNISGAILLYGLLKIQPISKKIEQITFSKSF